MHNLKANFNKFLTIANASASSDRAIVVVFRIWDCQCSGYYTVNRRFSGR